MDFLLILTCAQQWKITPINHTTELPPTIYQYIALQEIETDYNFEGEKSKF